MDDTTNGNKPYYELDTSWMASAYQDGWIIMPVTKPWLSVDPKVRDHKLGLVFEPHMAGLIIMVAIPVGEKQGPLPEGAITLEQFEGVMMHLAGMLRNVSDYLRIGPEEKETNDGDFQP